MSAIGSVWAQPSWLDDVWADGTWAERGDVITGTFEVASGAPTGSLSGRVAKFGGTQTGPSVFEKHKARITDVAGTFHVEHAGRSPRFSGVVAAPAHGAFAVGGHRRFTRMKGTIDRTPIIEDEAFLLGFLLGDDA